MNRSIRLLAVAVPLSLLLASCCSLTTPKDCGDWPLEWSHRKVFSTSQAYIYAAKPSAASQADEACQAAAKEFRGFTGHSPSWGIILVNDANDKLFVEDRAKNLQMIRQAREIQDASDAPDSDNKKDVGENEMNQMQEAGMDAAVFLQTMPMAISARQLVDMGLPAKSDTWAIAVPTDELVWNYARSSMDVMLKKNTDVGIGAKIAITVLMPFMQGTVKRQARAIREITVFCQFVAHDDTLGIDRKNELIAQFVASRRVD